MQQLDEEDIKLLCRCLAAVSVADGELDGRETATMISIVEQVTGENINAEVIVDACLAVESDLEGFQKDLQARIPGLSDEIRLLILNACIMVGRADSFMIEHEANYLVQLGTTLGFSREEIQRQFEIIS